MKIEIFIRIVICIVVTGALLFAYIGRQNTITELRLQIPHIAKELEVIRQENVSLQFEINRFENPRHLMELADQPQYGHLKYPLLSDILVIVHKNVTNDDAQKL
jgi:hypothetical protein